MRRLLVAGLLFGGCALAVNYQVDSTGGPLTLHDEVAAAASQWLAADPDLELQESAPATAFFSFGNPDLMGPDLVTLTLQTDEQVRIMVQPDLYRGWPGALTHEAGLLLGVPSGNTGVMNPALAAGSPTEPQPEDLQALAARRSLVPGDLTGDGLVDFLDLLEMADQYGRRGINLPADLDGDGTVGSTDLQMLRQSYSFTIPEERPAEAPAAPEEPASEPVTDEPASDSDPEPVTPPGE